MLIPNCLKFSIIFLSLAVAWMFNPMAIVKVCGNV